jgi:hypothetical protein
MATGLIIERAILLRTDQLPTSIKHLLSKSCQWDQTSTPAQLKLSLFGDVTQRRLAVGHRRFGTNYRNHLQASSCPRRIGGTGGRVNGRRCERFPVLNEIRKLDYFALEYACDIFSRNVGNQPPTYTANTSLISVNSSNNSEYQREFNFFNAQ